MVRKFRVATATMVTASLAVSIGAGTATAAPQEVTGTVVDVSVAEDSVTTTVTDPAGLEAEVVVDLTAGPDGSAFELDAVSIDAVVDGEEIVEELVVESFLPLGDEDFVATLRLVSTGEVLHLDTTVVEGQALPVLAILGVLARMGIKHVITWIGKTQLKKAVKSYLLNTISSAKWAHIMAPKHKWGTVGARSREQVAELMGRAMAEGTHSAYGSSAMQAVWRYQGKTIVVTYSRSGGQVSNGWVR